MGVIKRGTIEFDKDVTLIVNRGEASPRPLLGAIHAINLCEDFDSFKVLVKNLIEGLISLLYIKIKKEGSRGKAVIEDVKSSIASISLEVIRKIYGGILDRTDLHSLLEISCLKKVVETLGSEKLIVESEVSVSTIEPSNQQFDAFPLSLGETRVPYKMVLSDGRLEVNVDYNEASRGMISVRALTSVLERIEEILVGMLMKLAPDPLSQGLIYVTWNSEESALSWLSGERSSCSSFRYEGLGATRYEYNMAFADVLYFSFWEKVTRSFCHYRYGGHSKLVEDKLCHMLETLKYLIRGRYVLQNEEFLYVLRTERLPLKYFSAYVRRLLFTGLALSNAREGALVIIEDVDCCVPPQHHPLVGLAAMVLSATLKVRLVISTSSSLVALPFILQNDVNLHSAVGRKVSFEIYELNDEEVSKVNGDYKSALRQDFDLPELESYVKLLTGNY